MTLEPIIFEWITVKPTKQGYYCPFNCGDPRFRKPTWKTEKWFRWHMAKCSKRPSIIKSENEAIIEAQKLYEIKLKEIQEQYKHYLWKEVHYVEKIIVKDTHKWNWRRMVKVRYEPILRYEWRSVIIKTIWISQWGSVIFNWEIFLNSLVATLEEAKIIAENKTKWDEEYREMSSQFR